MSPFKCQGTFGTRPRPSHKILGHQSGDAGGARTPDLQETTARDFPSPLANVFDRYPFVEVLFEEVADQPLRAASASSPDNLETKQNHDNRRGEDNHCAAHD